MRLLVSRLVSPAVGFALAFGPVAPQPARASGPTELPGEASENAKQINGEAQSQYENGDLKSAAKTYSRVLEILTENKVNRAERDNTLLITLVVYIEAYRKSLDNGEELEQAIELLRSGVRLYDGYVAEYQRVYGGGADPSQEARKSGKEIKALLAEAEAKLGPKEVPPPPEVKKKKKEPVLVPIDVPTGRDGVGLIVGGSITIAGGASA